MDLLRTGPEDLWRIFPTLAVDAIWNETKRNPKRIRKEKYDLWCTFGHSFWMTVQGPVIGCSPPAFTSSGVKKQSLAQYTCPRQFLEDGPSRLKVLPQEFQELLVARAPYPSGELQLVLGKLPGVTEPDRLRTLLHGPPEPQPPLCPTGARETRAHHLRSRWLIQKNRDMDRKS